MKSNLKLSSCIFFIYIHSIGFCQTENKQVSFFKDTEAFELAIAVENEDLAKIEKLVQENSKLLEITNPISGSNSLSLSVGIEKYNSFNKLLELGSNPNFVNPFTKYSVLINACKYYNDWTIDNRYIIQLLNFGADPNYAVEESFEDERGQYHSAKSPLTEASRINLEMVKILIDAGADPNMSLGSTQESPFTNALSGFKDRFVIIDYFIDSLKINVHQPLKIRDTDTLFIQDYIKKFMSYNPNSEGDSKKKRLIKKLENMGVDFNNYNYKL